MSQYIWTTKFSPVSFPNYKLLTDYARGNGESWSIVFRAVAIKVEIPWPCIYDPPRCKWDLSFYILPYSCSYTQGPSQIDLFAISAHIPFPTCVLQLLIFHLPGIFFSHYIFLSIHSPYATLCRNTEFFMIVYLLLTFPLLE